MKNLEIEILKFKGGSENHEKKTVIIENARQI